MEQAMHLDEREKEDQVGQALVEQQATIIADNLVHLHLDTCLRWASPLLVFRRAQLGELALARRRYQSLLGLYECSVCK